jgi:hypothetical protein
MNAATPSTIVQPQETISSYYNQMSKLYSAVIGGASPIPPNQTLIVPIHVLKQYEQLIQQLDEQNKLYQQMVSELLRDREEMPDPISNPVKLSAAATEVVNSLIASVPAKHYFQDEVEGL